MSASNTARIIDLETDQNEAQARLQFQDFTETAAETHAPQQGYTSFPVGGMNDDDDDAESDELLSREKKRPSFWEFSYYQSLFDVTTTDVLKRFLWSSIPTIRGPNYLDKHIRPNPDLYGPVWVGITLIVTTSVSSNVADYLESVGRNKEFWHTDYTRVSFATSAILLYIFLLPLAIWAILKYRNIESRYTLLETICLYGYSLSIYIPISVLWAIHITWLRWVLMIVGATLSGTVLVFTFWPALKDEQKRMSLVVISFMFLFHALLALGFVEYFFHHSHDVPSGTSTTVSSITSVGGSIIPHSNIHSSLTSNLVTTSIPAHSNASNV